MPPFTAVRSTPSIGGSEPHRLRTSPGPGASVDAAVAGAARRSHDAMAPGQQARIETDVCRRVRPNVGGGETSRRRRECGLGRQQAARANLDGAPGDGVVPGPWPPSQDRLPSRSMCRPATPGTTTSRRLRCAPLGPMALFPGLGRLDRRDRPGGPSPWRPMVWASRPRGRSVGAVIGVSTAPRARRTRRTRVLMVRVFAHLERLARTVGTTHLEGMAGRPVFALVDLGVVESGIACFDTQCTSISGDHTGSGEPPRSATTGRTGLRWLPLLWTPPEVSPPTFLIPRSPTIPPSADDVRRRREVLRDGSAIGLRFSVTSTTLPRPKGARFHGFAHAARRAGLSRVYEWHSLSPRRRGRLGTRRKKLVAWLREKALHHKPRSAGGRRTGRPGPPAPKSSALERAAAHRRAASERRVPPCS